MSGPILSVDLILNASFASYFTRSRTNGTNRTQKNNIYTRPAYLFMRPNPIQHRFPAGKYARSNTRE